MKKIERVLLATINADHPQKGMIQAFKKVFGDENVFDFDYCELSRRRIPNPAINDKFFFEATRVKPDWVWLQVQDTGILDHRAVSSLRESLPNCVVTHWTGDLRPEVSPYMSSFSKVCHITLASSVGQLPKFRAAGAPNARYLQIGLDWDEDVLGLPEWEPPFRVPDVVFCGNHYGRSFPGTKDRVLAVETLINAGIDIGVVGGGWPKNFPTVGMCHVKQQHHVWKRAKIALNVNNFNDVEGYYSDRQIISMASGTPLVCRYIPGLEKEFSQEVHCLWYEEPKELLDHVARLLGDPALRKQIGEAGKEEVIKNHTWESRIRCLLPEIERAASRTGST